MMMIIEIAVSVIYYATPPYGKASCSDGRCLSVCLSVCHVPDPKSSKEGRSKLKIDRRQTNDRDFIQRSKVKITENQSLFDACLPTGQRSRRFWQPVPSGEKKNKIDYHLVRKLRC